MSGGNSISLGLYFLHALYLELGTHVSVNVAKAISFFLR